MRAVIPAFAAVLALVVLLPSAPAADAAEGWSAVGIQVREGRRPAAGVEVRLRPETASTAVPGALATGVTDEEGRAVIYLQPGIWRLELSTGERVDYFVTVRVVPGRRAEELGSPARDVDAPDLRWRYFAVDEPPPLDLSAPIRRETTTEPAPAPPPADEAPAAAEPSSDAPPPSPAGPAAQPPAEPDSVVPPPSDAPPADAPPADGDSGDGPAAPPPAPSAEPADDGEPSAGEEEAIDPTPSDSSPFGTLPRPASPYDPPPAAPSAPEAGEEPSAAPAPVPAQPAEPPAPADRPPVEESPAAPALPPPVDTEPSEPAVDQPPVEDPPVAEEPVVGVPVEQPAVEEPALEPTEITPDPVEESPEPLPTQETTPDAAPMPAPAPEPEPVTPPVAEPVEPELPPTPPRFAASAVGECPDCRDDEASVVVERTVSPGGGVCGPEIAVAALDAARRLGAAAGEPRSLDAGPVARWTAGDGCQVLGVVLPVGARYRGYRYEVEGGDAAGRCYAGSECPVAGAVWPDRPVIRPLDGGETLVYGLFRNTSAERARRARLTVYYLP